MSKDELKSGIVGAASKTQEVVTIAVNKARTIPKRLTAGIAVGIFELFLQIFPNTMSEHWQSITYNTIGIVGATGIVDWAWRKRKEAFLYIKNLLTKKKKEN
jgi:hypothetical protein